MEEGGIRGPERREGLEVRSAAAVRWQVLLDSLLRSAQATGLALPPLYLVDDRPDAQPALDLPCPAGRGLACCTAAGGVRRRRATSAGGRPTPSGWRSSTTTSWSPSSGWPTFSRDLQQRPSVGGVQGRISVPLPADRRPTDWERGTAGLETAKWITADMAYRTDVLRRVGGFDERFPRAFREDADLALRVLDAGYRAGSGRAPYAASGTSRGLVGQPAPAARQRRRRANGPGARPGLAAPRRGAVGPTSAAPAHHRTRPGRSGRLGAAPPEARRGGRRRLGRS